MNKKFKILLLSGSGEARGLANILSQDQSLMVISSLSGATRRPIKLPVQTRIGGFGGYDQQRAYITEQEFDAVVDATHPFADAITQRTQGICAELSVPYLYLRRPQWEPEPEDDWTLIDEPSDAKALIPVGSTVFLATGRGTLVGFANLSEMKLICRQIDPPDGAFPYKNGSYLIGRPPFSVEEEVALFLELGVDVLIVKNAGGLPSRTKLDAARILGIKVLMLRRPPMPKGESVQTVEAAVLWLKALQEVSLCL